VTEHGKIEFRCGQCDTLLRVAQIHRGKWLTCPRCQEEMRVPDEPDPPLQVNDTVDVVWAPQTVSVAEIFRDTWEIYVENLWMLLGVAIVDLILYAIGLVLILFPAGLAGVLLAGAGGIPRELVFLGIVLLAILGFITLSNVMACRHAKFFLKLARGESVGMAEALRIELHPKSMTFLPIAFGLIVGIGLLIMVIPGVYVYLTLWPYLWVWADRQTADRSVEAFPLSRELTKRNMGPSVAVSLVVLIGSFFGQAEIFTGTFARLLKAVAYLKMSGQEVITHRTSEDT
jgi:hypothetical protein